MRKTAKKFLAVTAALLALVSNTAVSAQKGSMPWIEMSRKDADKLLNDSPWAQTQIDTDVSEMFYSPTRPGAPSTGRSTKGLIGDQQSVNNNRADRGAVNQAVSIKFRICFLSAKPVRRAFARMILSSEPRTEDNLVERLDAFVERDFSQYIVIAITAEANDERFTGPIMQALNSATTGTMKNRAYLERQDGKRLFISAYQPPIPDGLGAKFIFQRVENGEQFLNPRSESVRFVAEFTDSFKLNMRYKVADMIYGDRLEY